MPLNILLIGMSIIISATLSENPAFVIEVYLLNH